MIINRKHGCIEFSDEILAAYRAEVGAEIWANKSWRTDEVMIRLIGEYGDKSSKYLGKWAASRLVVVEIPDDVEWEINDYDGIEWVAEKHRVWGNVGTD